MNDLSHCTPAINEKTLMMARDIKSKDVIVDYCDAILVSHAILDENARYILTTDTAMHNSEIIQRKIDDRGEGFCKLSLKDSLR